jgi:hypothetical protein
MDSRVRVAAAAAAAAYIFNFNCGSVLLIWYLVWQFAAGKIARL